MLLLNENKLGHSNVFFQVISGGEKKFNKMKKTFFSIFLINPISAIFWVSCLYAFEEALVSGPREQKEENKQKLVLFLKAF